MPGWAIGSPEDGWEVNPDRNVWQNVIGWLVTSNEDVSGLTGP